MGGYCSNLTLNNPNFNQWLSVAWGSGASYEVVCNQFYGASNFVFGQNPPYYMDQFKAIHPKFFGTATALSGCGTEIGQPIVTVPSTNGLDYGQFVQAWGVFPKGTFIVDLGDNVVTLNNAALVTNANATLNVYASPPIPTGVIQMYLNLAHASLVEARWCAGWWNAMALYIAHYCTLYARSDSSEVFESLQTIVHGETPVGTVPGTVYTLSAPPPGGALQSLTKNGSFLVPSTQYTLSGNTVTLTEATVLGDVLYATWLAQEMVLQAAPMNGAQIAAQGLAFGLQTSKSVGDVSVGYTTLEALADWGSWNLTVYGQELITLARVVGMGPALIW
jgi:hypothetical protein